MILSWHENRPREEIPPRWMWPFSDEIERWFQRIDDEKAEARGDRPAQRGGKPASGGVYEQNEYAKWARAQAS